MTNRATKVLAGIALLFLLLLIAALFLDEPLRAYIEGKMNRNLKGYRVQIGALEFHPIGASVDLHEIRLERVNEPDPAVATIARWSASVHWRALLSGRLVSDHEIERPKFHISRALAKREAGNETPVKDRGWQDAVESVYPFKINQVSITDGEILYVDEAKPDQPLRARRLNVYASNIRNVQSADQAYPSEFSLDGLMFESGKIRLDGRADFLAEPYAAVKAELGMDGILLASLVPVTGRYNLQLTGGTLSGEGAVEYGPSVKVVNLKRLTIEGLHLDYVHAAETQRAEVARAKATVETAQSINAKEDAFVRVDRISIIGGELGYVDGAAKPEYRVYLTDADLTLERYSSRLSDGPASLAIQGKFMGTGETEISGTMRPSQDSPDLELKIKIANTQIRSMNNLLRAHGNFDVVKGLFSCYSEIRIDDGSIDGYVKPLVRKLKVYDSAQDRDKPALDKIKEGAIEDLSTLLENVPRQAIATKAHLSGPANRPQTEIVEIVIGLIQNAFFKAILPGFEREFAAK